MNKGLIRALAKVLFAKMNEASYGCEMNHAFDGGEWSSAFDDDVYKSKFQEFIEYLKSLGLDFKDFISGVSKFDDNHRKHWQWNPWQDILMFNHYYN